MIVIDIETTGLSPEINSMISLGAVDLTTGEEFYGECRVPYNKEVSPSALLINGAKREDIYDINKPFPWELYSQFLRWCNGRQMLLGGQQIASFDVQFLRYIHDNYIDSNIKWPFGYRYVDLHSIAYAKFGVSLSLDEILQTIGLEKEPKPHNALNGAKLEAEALKLLINKK
jgi:DNA polymerase-3 subunit epsilon